MKIFNNSSKTITLLNGKTIAPRKSLEINVPRNSEVYEQVKKLEKNGLIDVN